MLTKSDFTEINNNTTQDYWYDGNGNYTKDNNKGISAVTYNFMNLPQQLTIIGKGTIAYTYDAAGNKLQKKITEGARVVTYMYSGSFLYKNDTLQYSQTAEGRIRYRTTSGTPAYDYYLKDHLGNVRMVLTDEKDTAKYTIASLESTPLPDERQYYSGLDSGRVNKNTVPGYPSDGTTSPNDYIQQLSGSGYKIGSGMLLKVMNGDKFNIKVSSWYKANGAIPNIPNNIAGDVVTSLISSLTGPGGPVHGSITRTQLENANVIPGVIDDFLSNQPAPGTTRPKAYLNWVLLDEQFKYVESGSGAEQVPDESAFGTAPNNQVYQHVRLDLPITKNGYLYVFVSNETPNINVFFDNLQVTHIKGPLLEESHYYPFGTEMAGISSHSLPSYVANRYKANAGAEYGDEEWANGSGLEMYETFYRSYNAQIGRFLQGDPLMELSMESYAFGKNNPVSFTDFFGDLETAEYKTLEEIVIKKYSFSNTAENVSNWVDLLLASSGSGGSSDWSFLGENGGGGGGGGGNTNISAKTDTIPRRSTSTKNSATKAAIAFAISAAEADGPLLYGDAVGVVVVGGAVVYDHWDDIISTADNVADYFSRLFSKQGKRNLYDDQLSPLSDEQLRQLETGARAAKSTELLKKINTEWKRRKQTNKQKRDSRGY